MIRNYPICGLAAVILSITMFTNGEIGHPPQDSTNLNASETRLVKELHESERRINRRIKEKLRQQNHSIILQMQKSMRRVNEQLAWSRESEIERGQMVKSLHQQLVHQQREIHYLKDTVHILRKVATNLTTLVRELLQKGLSDYSLTTTLPTTTQQLPPNPLYPGDCQEVYNDGGMKYPGDYYIMIQPGLSTRPFGVACTVTHSAGWTLIQRRQDGSEDFYRTWEEYKDGFGNLEGEFWLGNQHIYELTNQGNYKLRIEMTDWHGKKFFAEYKHFRISDEEDNYRIHVHGYHGNAGDSLTTAFSSHNNKPFSTKDRDNDARFHDNCAEHFHGGWWFNACFESHLNGRYYPKRLHNNYFIRDGIQWNGIHRHSSLRYVAMMVKPTEITSEDLQNDVE